MDKNGGGIFLKLSSTELYDPATNTFAPGPEMNWRRLDAVAVQLPPASVRPH
ncbi:MAG: kelch repeat-containing protein [Candidatus Binatus sp.]|nr:kelch repeat-containing protein [Candidatus Binatus sp.]